MNTNPCFAENPATQDQTANSNARRGRITTLLIVDHHGGKGGVDSVLGDGTVFRPPAGRSVAVGKPRVASPRPGTGRVLFMDDEEQLCALNGAMLASLGYNCDLVRNGEDAVLFYKRHLDIGRPYDAVILDLTIIGGMGGDQTCRLLRALDPGVRAILASGCDYEDMVSQFGGIGFCGYLPKPYRTGDLGRMLRTVLGE